MAHRDGSGQLRVDEPRADDVTGVALWAGSARRGDVQHHADRSREVSGEASRDRLERLDATRRRTDHDKVSCPHLPVGGAFAGHDLQTTLPQAG